MCSVTAVGIMPLKREDAFQGLLKNFQFLQWCNHTASSTLWYAQYCITKDIIQVWKSFQTNQILSNEWRGIIEIPLKGSFIEKAF